MIVTITEVSTEFTKNGAEYRKVKGITSDGKETTKSVFDSLEDKWNLLQENRTLEFKVEKKGQFWNVVDILEVEVPPPTKATILPEHQKEIDKAVAGSKPPPSGQEAGKTKYKADPAKINSIERQVAMKLACEISSDTETLEQIFTKADKIYEWISRSD